MYGSNKQTNPRLSNSRISWKNNETKKTSSVDGVVSVLRWTIVAAEILGSIALSVASGGTALPLVGTLTLKQAQLGMITLGLAGATANTAISSADGSLTGIGIAIDYGSALIGSGAFIKQTNKIKNSVELGMESMDNMIGQIADKTLKHIQANKRQFITQSKKVGTNIRRIDKLSNKTNKIKKIKKIKNATGLIDDLDNPVYYLDDEAFEEFLKNSTKELTEHSKNESLKIDNEEFYNLIVEQLKSIKDKETRTLLKKTAKYAKNFGYKKNYGKDLRSEFNKTVEGKWAKKTRAYINKHHSGDNAMKLRHKEQSKEFFDTFKKTKKQEIMSKQGYFSENTLKKTLIEKERKAIDLLKKAQLKSNKDIKKINDDKIAQLFKINEFVSQSQEKGFGWSTKKGFFKYLEKINDDELFEIAKAHFFKAKPNQIYQKALQATITFKDESLKIMESLNIKKPIKDRFLNEYSMFINGVKRIQKGSRLQVNQTLEYIIKNVDNQEFTRQMDELIRVMNFKSELSLFSKKTSPISFMESMFGGSIKTKIQAQSQNPFGRLMSKLQWFGTKRGKEFVQIAQLLDPKDIGRTLPERMYQKVKYKVDKYFKKRLDDIVAKAIDDNKQHIVKSVKRFKHLDKARLVAVRKYWQSQGFKLFPFNRYIIGVKILKRNPTMLPSNPSKNFVMVRFSKEATQAKKYGRNLGGKKPIFTHMSDRDIKELTTGDWNSHWYTFGRKRGWWGNRGGKLQGNNFGRLNPELSLFLSIVPIGALRQFWSMTSNIIENVDSMISGRYWPKFMEQFSGSLLRTTLNRTGRLTARAAVGGASKNLILKNVLINKDNLERSLDISHMYGSFIGRELQRITSFSLSNSIKTSSTGMISFNKINNFGEKFAKQSLTATARTIGVRTGNKMGMRGQRAFIGSRRNLNNITRGYSALTPNSKVKSFRQMTKIK